MADRPPPHVRVNLPGMMNSETQPGPNSWAIDAKKEKTKKETGHPPHQGPSNQGPSRPGPADQNPSNLGLAKQGPQGTAATIGSGEESHGAPAVRPQPKIEVRKHRDRIYPAIPLVPVTRKAKINDPRAITDPIRTKPDLGSENNGSSASRTPVPQKSDIQKELPALSSKASQDSSILPNKTKRLTPPSSAPASTVTRMESLPDSSDRSRQTHSTPTPGLAHAARTHRWLNDTKHQVPPMARNTPMVPPKQAHNPTAMSQASGESMLGSDERQARSEGMILGGETMTPTRQGTYGTTGQGEIVQGATRTSSVKGVIEHVVEGEGHNHGKRGSDEQGYPSVGSSAASLRYDNPLDSASTMRPSIHGEEPSSVTQFGELTPIIYQGVWENNPNVGRSLPPFSPTNPYGNPQAQANLSDSCQNTNDNRISLDNASSRYPSDGIASGNVPLNFQDHASGVALGVHAQPSRSSFNSWASYPRGNSFAPSNPSAVPQPLFASNAPRDNNFVPAPNHPDFVQIADPLQSDVMKLSLTIHHHIETSFNKLEHKFTDTHDRTLDAVRRDIGELKTEMVRHWENMKSQFDDLRHYVTDIKQSSLHVRPEIVKLADQVRETDKAVHGLATGTKEGLTRLEDRIQEASRASISHLIGGESSGAGNQSTRRGTTVRGGATQFVPRSVPNQPGQPSDQQYDAPSEHIRRSGGSYEGRQSGATTSAGRGRSNASGVGAGGGRLSGEDRVRFAQAARAFASVEPDLRQHPAFRGAAAGFPDPWAGGDAAVSGAQQAENLVNLPFPLPSFTGGAWYQQAYGHRN